MSNIIEPPEDCNKHPTDQLARRRARDEAYSKETGRHWSYDDGPIDLAKEIAKVARLDRAIKAAQKPVKLAPAAAKPRPRSTHRRAVTRAPARRAGRSACHGHSPPEGDSSGGDPPPRSLPDNWISLGDALIRVFSRTAEVRR